MPTTYIHNMGSNWNVLVSAKLATQFIYASGEGGKRDAWSGVEGELAHGKLGDTEGTNAQLPCKLWLLVRGSYQTHPRSLNSAKSVIVRYLSLQKRQGKFD
ncbi:LOW QUALITY PROTEIN: hypothetical protein V1478_018138 [Vespula squamosa]|uniref:Uncharacterized protein n=1 Tax=Vespula squamosa TaxID=30214 RepID=A0ABD1ZYL6_VESSQ